MTFQKFPPEALLGELAEDQATGEIAAIYAEIRRISGVPYVSSLQRYLATMPGVLEWAWTAVRPGMISGVVPRTGWRLAETVRVAALPAITTAQLHGWNVDPAGLTAIRNVAANFLRVSPVNLMTGACLHLLLTGTSPSGAGFAETWTPPEMLAPMPGNVDPAHLAEAERAVLLRFTTEVDGAPFIPALYRQLAHWPQFLAWLADQLAPRFDAAETEAGRAGFRRAAWAAAPGIVARLPGLPPGPAPGPEATRRVLATIDRYAMTSPEMTMFGRLILQSLPEA